MSAAQKKKKIEGKDLSKCQDYLSAFKLLGL